MSNKNLDEDTPKIDFPIQKKGLKHKLKKTKQRFIQLLKVFNTLFGLALISTVFLFPYPTPIEAMNPVQNNPGTGMDNKVVYIQEESYNKVFDNFDSEIEEGFCLFGKVNKSSIKIEKVLYAETVILQTPQRINNMCVDEIKEELPRMYMDYSYKFIGKVHTHPVSDKAKPSIRDIHSFGKLSLFTEITGVASNDSINFYTHDSLGMGVPVKHLDHS